MIAASARRTSAPKFFLSDPMPGTRRFTVEAYHQLGDAGILTEEDRVELIDGWILEKDAQKPPHATSSARIQRHLPRIVPAEHELRFQLPITLSTSEPEPDVVVARGPLHRYDEGHPGPKDVLMVLEVSHSSLEFDRGPKLLLYAAAKIPIYWIVNIPDDRIEAYSHPKPGKTPGYRSRVHYSRGAKVPLFLRGKLIVEIQTDALLP